MLQSLVKTASKALEDEDDFLRKKISANDSIYAGQRAGILRLGFMDERYFQRLVARQLLSEAYEVKLEETRHDLVLLRSKTSALAVVEMKLWMRGYGSTEKISEDIKRLRIAVSAPQHRIMLIFSANPRAGTNGSVNYLSEQLTATLGVPLTMGQNFEFDSFQTYSDYPNVKNDDMELWVAGIEVS